MSWLYMYTYQAKSVRRLGYFIGCEHVVSLHHENGWQPRGILAIFGVYWTRGFQCLCHPRGVDKSMPGSGLFYICGSQNDLSYPSLCVDCTLYEVEKGGGESLILVHIKCSPDCCVVGYWADACSGVQHWRKPSSSEAAESCPGLSRCKHGVQIWPIS